MNVSQATYDAFRAAVFTKHGKLREVLMAEADAALRTHLKRLNPPGSPNGHKAAGTQQPVPPPETTP